MSFDFRKWIQGQKGNYAADYSDPDHLRLMTETAEAEINFYKVESDTEVTEFVIRRRDADKVEFFLHFQAVDEEHSKGLFREMTEALESIGENHTEEILLCCSSGMTTGYFAEQLNLAAETLHLDYHFSAVNIGRVYEAAVGKEAVLLAPQIGYAERKLRERMPGQLIVQIPTAVFASYDSGKCLEFVREQIRLHHAGQQESDPAADDIAFGEKILVIACASARDRSKIYYRMYERGKALKNQKVIKKKLTIRDIEDVIDTQICSCSGRIDADAVCIAIPGSIHDGRLDLMSDGHFDLQNGERNNFDIVAYFRGKYGIPVYVLNNTNAAVLGWQAKNPSYRNVCFFSMPRGWIYGGQGTIMDGHLVEGRMDSAGELKYVLDQFRYSNPLRFSGYNPDDVMEIVVHTLLADIAILDPEAICIRCELTPDMEEVRRCLLQYVPEEHIPELIYIDDFYRYILCGEAEYCVRMARRQQNGDDV